MIVNKIFDKNNIIQVKNARKRSKLCIKKRIHQALDDHSAGIKQYSVRTTRTVWSQTCGTGHKAKIQYADCVNGSFNQTCQPNCDKTLFVSL